MAAPSIRQPPKNMASFKDRLDPVSKSAVKVLMLGNELVEVNRKEGLALLGSANDILRKRHGRVNQRGISRTEKLGEAPEQKRDRVGQPATEAKPAAPGSSTAVESTTEARSITPSVLSDFAELLGSGSVKDAEGFVWKLQKYLGSTPEVEDVLFDKIGSASGERDYEVESQAQQAANFDEQHHGHTYFCKGDIWQKLEPRNSYKYAQSKLSGQDIECDRCWKTLLEQKIWVCEVGLCGLLICEECWREYENKRKTR